jgi:hypothetical protein
MARRGGWLEDRRPGQHPAHSAIFEHRPSALLFSNDAMMDEAEPFAGLAQYFVRHAWRLTL